MFENLHYSIFQEPKHLFGRYEASRSPREVLYLNTKCRSGNTQQEVASLLSNNIKQSEKKMFWSYCLASGFFPPELMVCLPQTQDSPPSSTQQIITQAAEDYIDLTAEDHLKAGYDKIKKPWSEEEDKKLKELRDKKNFEWEQIAQVLPGRNAKMCYSRYKRLEYNPREHWKPSEEDLLRLLVEEKGENWPVIVPHFKNRTAKQVKDHYINFLKVETNRDHWTMDEDMRLVELLNQYGRNWKSIQECLEGRTQNQIKNRYFGRIKKLQEKKQKAKVEETSAI